MDRERATMNAATAIAVRPRFLLMLPAAIFPVMPPRQVSAARIGGVQATTAYPVMRLRPNTMPKRAPKAI